MSKMSKREKKVNDILVEIFTQDQVKSQIEINGCPFNKKGKHRTDFYLPFFELYIEVKGMMTLYETNVLEYLLRHADKTFYVFQVDCEDWISPFNENEMTAKKKIDINIEIQKEELEQLRSGNIKPEELQRISIKRLIDYRAIRAADLSRWTNKT